MTTRTTNGVRVSVETFYQKDYSNPLQREFMFAYKVTIENTTGSPVKLWTRHFDIVDGDGASRSIDGEGVVGMQPVIPTGETYSYVSGVNLHCELGHMSGFYSMENLDTKELFSVDIPRFEMYVPYLFN